MTSKFQKRAFPLERLIKIQSIKGLDSDNNLVELKYQEFSLVFLNNQLCLQHRITEQVIPIARVDTLRKLMEKIE